MESMSQDPSPDRAAALLAEAEQARRGLAGAVALPARYDLWIGATVALQIGLAAIGIAVDEVWARSLLVAGVVLFGLVAGWQLHRFRRVNGVWLHGFASRAVFGTATAASIAYAAGLAGAVMAAFQELWWLVGLCALAGGAGYALGGRRWLRAYRQDPASHARSESVLLLALVGLLAAVGAVLLVTLR